MIIEKGVVCANARTEGGIRLSGGKTNTSMASVSYVLSDIPEGTEVLRVRIEYEDLSKKDAVAGILAVRVTEGEKTIYDQFILRSSESSEEFIFSPVKRYIKNRKIALWVTTTGWGHLEVSHLEVEYLRGVPPEKEERVIYQNRYWQAWGDSDVDMYFYVFPASYCYWPHHWGYICYQYDPYWYWYTWRPYYYREIVVVHHIYVYHYYHHPHHHYYDCNCDYNNGPLVTVGPPKEPLAVVGSPREPLVRVGSAREPLVRIEGSSEGKVVKAQTQPNYHKDKVRVWRVKQSRVADRTRFVRKEKQIVRSEDKDYTRYTAMTKPVVYRDYIKPKPKPKPKRSKDYTRVYTKRSGDSRKYYYRSETRKVSKKNIIYTKSVRDQRTPQKPRNSQKPKNPKAKSR